MLREKGEKRYTKQNGGRPATHSKKGAGNGRNGLRLGRGHKKRELPRGRESTVLLKKGTG